VDAACAVRRLDATCALACVARGMLFAIALCACGRGAVPPQTDTGGAMLAAPPLGIVLDDALRVVHVEPGGTAAGAGVRPGDALHAIRGREVASPAEARRVFYEVPASIGDPVEIIVRRSDQNLRLTGRVSVAARAGPTPTPVFLPQVYL